MTLTVLRSCLIHGSTDWRVYQRPDGVRQRCLACRREKESIRHNHGERCRVRGHLKTPWTWRFYRNQWKCLLCEYTTRAQRRQRRQQEQAS